jgi:hypothetical protein
MCAGEGGGGVLKSLKLYPGSRKKRSKYEKWREAWEILRGRVRRGRR